MWCIVLSGVEEIKISKVALDLSNSRRECRQGVTHRFYTMLNLNGGLRSANLFYTTSV